MSHGQRHSRGEGFTLIELLLVMVLMATLTGAVVVSLTGRQDSRTLEFAAKDLAAAMRFAAKQAAVHGVAYRVAFCDDHTSYRVERCSDAAMQDYVPAKGVAGQFRRFPKRVCLVAADCGAGWEATIPESLEWKPAKYVGMRIRLSGKGDESYLIEMAPETGIISVEEESNES